MSEDNKDDAERPSELPEMDEQTRGWFMAHPILIAVGSVATGWASLEHEINRVIWALAAVADRDGACITAQMIGVMPRMRALIALAHRKGCDEALLKKLNKFTTKVDGLGRQRNRVVHDPWYVKDDYRAFGRLEISADTGKASSKTTSRP